MSHTEREVPSEIRISFFFPQQKETNPLYPQSPNSSFQTRPWSQLTRKGGLSQNVERRILVSEIVGAQVQRV